MFQPLTLTRGLLCLLMLTAAEAQPQTGRSRRVTVAASPAGPLPEVRVAAGSLTTIVLDAPLDKDSVQLDTKHFKLVDVGESSLTFETLVAPQRQGAVGAAGAVRGRGEPRVGRLRARGAPHRGGPARWWTAGGWLRPLGGGAYGSVYLVEKDGELYALKMARFLRHSGDKRRTDERAQRELNCLLSLQHRHIVQARFHGRWPHAKTGFFYVVMDYVEGYSLAEWVERTHPTPHEVVVLFNKVFLAVAYAHAQGIFHRDLKPNNILVEARTGEPVVVDFGAAYFPLPTQPLLTDTLHHSRPQPKPLVGLDVPRAQEVNARVPRALSQFVASLLQSEPAKRPVSVEAARRVLAELHPLQGEGWTQWPVHAPLSPPSEAEEARPQELDVKQPSPSNKICDHDAPGWEQAPGLHRSPWEQENLPEWRL